MQNGAWHTKDLDSSELTCSTSFKGIPPRCVYATVLFALGNRHLENGLGGRDAAELDQALNYYSTAIALYPENPRFYFNRAIALENQGMTAEAGSDYRMALADEDRLVRVLARQHDEVVGLIKLDDKSISAKHQETYLLHKGFVTGVATPFADIALRIELPVEQVKEIVDQVEAALSSP